MGFTTSGLNLAGSGVQLQTLKFRAIVESCLCEGNTFSTVWLHRQKLYKHSKNSFLLEISSENSNSYGYPEEEFRVNVHCVTRKIEIWKFSVSKSKTFKWVSHWEMNFRIKLVWAPCQFASRASHGHEAYPINQLNFRIDFISGNRETSTISKESSSLYTDSVLQSILCKWQQRDGPSTWSC